ncbi:hypothetical protein [Roseobacter sp.]|uniref:hypothetical protein n=1 Tax=Roseobacter sp. TaxID=1907202 RepID=UPI0032998043
MGVFELYYNALYDWAQSQSPKFSINSIRDRIIYEGCATSTTEQWFGFNVKKLWSLFVRGPIALGACVVESETDFVIAIARDLNPQQRRIALTKELMRAFDAPAERATDSEKMRSTFKFLSGTTRTIGSIEASEGEAFYRVLGVLCPETERQDYLKQKLSGDVTDYEADFEFAAKLHLPQFVCSTLLDENFIERLEL